MQKIVKWLWMIFFISLAFLLPELLARVFLPEWKPPASDKPSLFVQNSYTGWAHPASATMDHYGGNITSNHLGLRDREWGEKNKPRVLFLGDSFTWGWGIGNNKDRYVDRLQEQFQDYQFINAGIVSFSNLQEFLLLKHYGDEIKPDYIVLQMFSNDFQENQTPDGIYPRPWIDVSQGNIIRNYPSAEEDASGIKKLAVFMGEHTYFYRQVVIRILLWMLDAGIRLDKEKPVWTPESSLTAMEVALGLLYQFASEHNIPVLVIFNGMEPYQVDAIEKFSTRHGITAVNIDPVFLSAQREWKDYTQHWNEYGHALAALYLQPYLKKFLYDDRQ